MLINLAKKLIAKIELSWLLLWIRKLINSQGQFFHYGLEVPYFL